MNRIIRKFEPILLVGGGEVGAQDLDLAFGLTSRCVAVDGGLAAVLAHGRVPDAVIGDLDSVSGEALAQVPEERVFHVAEQESTDFDKALRHVETPLVIAVGFGGGRMDHQMAAFHTLVARPNPRCLLLCAHEVVFQCPPQITIATEPGDTVSLFPFAQVQGRSDGLEWPIDGLAFAPDHKIGTSNRATGAMSLAMDGPGMLCFLPRARFACVTQALLDQDLGAWDLAARTSHARPPVRAE